MDEKFNSIDLFCGAGGMSKGFQNAGFDTVFAVEFNGVFAETYKQNFPDVDLFIGDIKDFSNEEIRRISKMNKIDIIIGGPPCQGFSMAGNIGRKFLDDDRNRLFLEYFRFVDMIRPSMFVLENVASLVTHNKGNTIKEIISTFEKIGYTVQYKVLNSVNFNVPQDRRRVFVIGTLNNFFFSYPSGKNEYLTIKSAIGDLPVLKSGESSSVALHTAMSHTLQMLNKMSYIKDGGNRFDIPADLRPKSGDIRKYIRYCSQKPSFCITGDMRKIFHYDQNRALTCRELARLQTFPDNYYFAGNSIQIQQQIGNAVPCNLAYAVAEACLRSLKHE